MSAEDLWKRNISRSWVSFLYNEFRKGAQGKDFETVRYWISQFKAGIKTHITVRGGVVEDGNHRLVAAKISNSMHLLVW